MLRWTLLLGALFLFTSSHAATDEMEGLDDSENLSLWEKFFDVSVSTGFDDNLLLTKKNKIDSVFISANASAFFYRLPLDSWQAYAYVDAEHVHYLDGDEVNKEEIMIAMTDFSKGLGLTEVWRLGSRFQYVYQDQILDDASLDTIRGTIQAQGHTLSVSPYVAREFGEDYKVSLGYQIAKQWYREPLDDFIDSGLFLDAGRKISRKSEWKMEYQWQLRDYATRRDVGADGFGIPNSSLKLSQHRVTATWIQSWEKDIKWRSRSRLRYRRSSDFSEGFFDYHYLEMRQEIRGVWKDWTLTSEVKGGIYDYDLQRIGIGSEEVRERKIFGINLALTRQVTKNLTITGSYEYERSLGNLINDDYKSNRYLTSLKWEF